MNMPQKVRDEVSKHGIRNMTLLTQAPTGSIATMVGTSTGIEPFFDCLVQNIIDYVLDKKIGVIPATVNLART